MVVKHFCFVCLSIGKLIVAKCLNGLSGGVVFFMNKKLLYASGGMLC